MKLTESYRDMPPDTSTLGPLIHPMSSDNREATAPPISSGRSTRPSALGKRNWLFVGHPETGERSAVIYTFLGSCRRHGVNPFDYLKDLLTRLPAAKRTQLQEFTPVAWAKAKAKERVFAHAA